MSTTREQPTPQEITDDAILSAYSATFQPDFYDPNDPQPTFPYEKKKLKNALDSRFVQVTSFFGLPNDIDLSVWDPKLTWEQLGLNFVGWNEKRPTSWNIIKVPFYVAWHLIAVPVKTALNIVRLGTEFFPSAIANLLYAVSVDESKIIKNIDDIKTNKLGTKVPYYARGLHSFLSVATFALSLPFFAWAFVGRAITSPIHGMRTAFRLGDVIAGAKDPEASKFRKDLGKTIGDALAIVSALITGAAYAAAIVFASPILITQLPEAAMPWIAAKLLPAVANIGLPLLTTMTAACISGIAAIATAVKLKLKSEKPDAEDSYTYESASQSDSDNDDRLEENIVSSNAVLHQGLASQNAEVDYPSEGKEEYSQSEESNGHGKEEVTNDDRTLMDLTYSELAKNCGFHKGRNDGQKSEVSTQLDGARPRSKQ